MTVIFEALKAFSVFQYGNWLVITAIYIFDSGKGRGDENGNMLKNITLASRGKCTVKNVLYGRRQTT